MTQETPTLADTSRTAGAFRTVQDWLSAEWLQSVPMLEILVGISLVAVVAYLADVIARRQLAVIVGRIADKTSSTFDDHFVVHKVPNRLAHLIPAAVVFYGVTMIPGMSVEVVAVIKSTAAAYMVFTVIRGVDGALSGIVDYYRTTPHWETRPIKGYVQVAKIIMYIVGFVLVVAVLMNRSPLVFLSGIGAMTAVVMLIFKDTILSFVASIQIATNDLIRVGDWIEMPQSNADGDVVDIALYSVTVQNWDKTVTTIPTFKIMQESFKNWRTMPESGGRRIKRSIFIDKNSIRFLTEEEIEKFKGVEALRSYIESKQKELRETNQRLGYTDMANVNARRLTNVGTFRAYIAEYLRHHPNVNQDLTLIVRQLQPGPHGLPIELYFFSNDTAWATYEGIQADVFDHLLAIIPDFGLRVYQQPSGSDVQQIAGSALGRGGSLSS